MLLFFFFAGTYCFGQFDGWSCFLDTPINTIAKSSCPPLFEFDTSRKETKQALYMTQKQIDLDRFLILQGLHTRLVRVMPTGFDIPRRTERGQITRRVSMWMISRWRYEKFNLPPFFRFILSYFHICFSVRVSAKTIRQPHLCHGLHYFTDSNSPINFHILLLQVSFRSWWNVTPHLATVSISLCQFPSAANLENLIIVAAVFVLFLRFFNFHLGDTAEKFRANHIIINILRKFWISIKKVHMKS